jgi:hypothetical protein
VSVAQGIAIGALVVALIAQIVTLCEQSKAMRALAEARKALNFKISDTPPSGPEEISGHPATAGPHNNKEIA